MSDLDQFFNYMQVIPSFRVGQRVRVITMLAVPRIRELYVGKEGIVTSMGLMSGIWQGQVGYFVEIRGVPTIQFTGNMLEAVVPDGHKPGSWDDCPWRPTD